MYSLTISNNRMLIRLLIFTMCSVIFLSSSAICFASEIESETETVTETETETTTESETSKEVVVDETVSSGDNLQTGDVSEESSLSYETLNNIYDILVFIAGIMIFFVVVLLCKYSYKFFNIFF